MTHCPAVLFSKASRKKKGQLNSRNFPCQLPLFPFLVLFSAIRFLLSGSVQSRILCPEQIISRQKRSDSERYPIFCPNCFSYKFSASRGIGPRGKLPDGLPTFRHTVPSATIFSSSSLEIRNLCTLTRYLKFGTQWILHTHSSTGSPLTRPITRNMYIQW